MFSLYGGLELGFEDGGMQIHVAGAAVMSLLDLASVKYSGELTLTFTSSSFNLQVAALANVSFLGDVGRAAGDLTVTDQRERPGGLGRPAAGAGPVRAWSRWGCGPTGSFSCG